MFYAPWDRASQEARQTLIEVISLKQCHPIRPPTPTPNCSCIPISPGRGLLQAHGHPGGGGQLLVSQVRLRQGVWKQVAGDSFSSRHILPGPARGSSIQRPTQGGPDNQVGFCCRSINLVNLRQIRWVQDCRYPLTHLQSAGHLSMLQVSLICISR